MTILLDIDITRLNTNLFCNLDQISTSKYMMMPSLIFAFLHIKWEAIFVQNHASCAYFEYIGK